MRRHGESGQAAIETVAMLPLLVAVALAIGHALSAEAARELAGHAAEAAAIAVARGTDPKEAAEASLPEWSRERMDVVVEGRGVRVRLRTLAVVPGVADLLATTATADAGPAVARDAGTVSEASTAETDRTNPSGR